MASDGRMTYDEKNADVAYYRIYTTICLEGLRKTTTKIQNAS
jgi:hypothetical protein